MKKITFKLFTVIFLMTVVSNAQNVSITAINGTDPTVFQNNTVTTPLTAGTVLDVEVTYTDVQDNGGASNLHIKLFDNWTFIAGTQIDETVTNSATSQTITIQLTVPSMNPGTTAGRLQVRGWNGSSWDIGNYVTNLSIAEDDVEVSAAVEITTINDQSVDAYRTSVNGELTEGDTLIIGVDYTAIKADPTRGDVIDVRVRFLDVDYALIPEGTVGSTTVTTSDTTQSTTVSLTVPNVDTSLTDVRIQALGYGFTGSEDGLTYKYANSFNIDASTLAVDKFEKNEINAYYSENKNAIVLSEAIKGEYIIYNLMGQSISKGEITNEINVSNLKSGVYIFSTEVGSLKFVK
ncbi:hypothetical protein R3X25_12650 [Lutibacter sp. TH_r2]|uniref:hypothetical protein n=1 Tax=Lutibacter sp. TH_r2 TaxID=3082083 RepID=UPI0029549A8E|nr:hypothetical protein [Lutibacter sp. TH_r2]MDV7188134.1 hypothetical protein [Lutibacter sp. TH_r2]